MAIFTAIAAAIGLTGFAATAFAFVGRTLLMIGVSKLIAKRAGGQGASGDNGGGRVQIPPATENKIPVVYGSAFVGGPITDAKISTDQKTMWYVVALAEHTDTTVGSGYTFGDIYYDGKLVAFSSGAAVASLTTNTTPAQTDTRMAGNLFIYLFTNGSSSGVNTGGQTAYDILSDPEIPVGQRWTSTDAMTNCAFAIVKVIYNADKGVTNLGSLQCQLTNTVDKPGDVILDYMLNTRYGCAIPLARIDTTSLTALNTYSDQNITYYQGATPLTQPRYRINGPLDTAQNCLNNLQILVDGCDSWLQYSELTGTWKVVINQSYTDYTTLNNLFLVDDSNLISGVQIQPIDLNETYNQIEVAYPNRNIKDQTDYQILDLTDPTTAWYDPTLLSPNEAINRLNITLPVVNEAVQAKYLAVRRLLQSREDIGVSFTLDYSGIQIEAGDVIRITFAKYGWTNKLFRVSNVTEEKDQNGNLFASIQAFEYNDTVYADNAIQDYVPEFNTGLTDPNVLGAPTAPIPADGPTQPDGTKSFTLSSNVPASGTVLYMDFNYGNTSNVQQHKRYSSLAAGAGNIWAANQTLTTSIVDLPAGNYYFSATARNKFAGNTSPASNVFAWSGPGISPVVASNGCGATSNGNTITANVILTNSFVGGTVVIDSGTGLLAANTTITSVISANTFTVNPTPLTPLSNACLTIQNGGVTGNTIQGNTITGNNIANNTITGNNIANYTITSNNLSNTGVVAGCYTAGNICVDAAGRVTSIANGTSGITGVNVQQSNANVNNNTTILNFTGAGVTVSNNGGNKVTINIPGAGGTGNIYYPSQARGGPISNVWTTLLRPVSDTLNIVGGLQFELSNGGVITNTWSATSAEGYPTNPYMLGTSSTGAGFLVNSSGNFVPPPAGLQEAGLFYANGSSYTGDGVHGWVVVKSVQNSVNNTDMQIIGMVDLISDTSMTVQVGGWAQYNYTNLNIYGSFVDFASVRNVTLTAYQSITVPIQYGSNANIINPILPVGVFVTNMSTGMAVRNPNTGTNLYVMSRYMIGFQG